MPHFSPATRRDFQPPFTLDKDSVGFTEKEYDYAVSLGIPFMAFIYDGIDKLPYDERESDPEKISKLNSFIEKAKTRSHKLWNNEADLLSNIMSSLWHMTKNKPRPGWVRGDEARTVKDAEYLASLEKKVRELENIVSEYNENNFEFENILDECKKEIIFEYTFSITKEMYESDPLYSDFKEYLIKKNKTPETLKYTPTPTISYFLRLKTTYLYMFFNIFSEETTLSLYSFKSIFDDLLKFHNVIEALDVSNIQTRKPFAEKFSIPENSPLILERFLSIRNIIERTITTSSDSENDSDYDLLFLTSTGKKLMLFVERNKSILDDSTSIEVASHSFEYYIPEYHW